MDRVERWLRDVETVARRPVAERVGELLEAVRRGTRRDVGESWDRANERHAEEFIGWLAAQFPGRVHVIARPAAGEAQEAVRRQWLDPSRSGEAKGSPVVVVERQLLPPLARLTTHYNYVFTVPGRSPECLVLVAHYDTWRGPGADDNTTGEEVAKQYLVSDLRAGEPPPLTHVYVLAGSEECGLIGFTSQVVLGVGIGLANMAWAEGLYVSTALALVLVPLAKFRFGVAGSRVYVRSLSSGEMALLKSVISVDSVGEGRLYIPESSLGADFVRAFIPFEGYEALNDILQEAAHLNGIKYNNFIAGGTTDHVSFLEVGSGLRDRLGDWLGCPRWLGCHRHGKRKIPAAALVSLLPGKASPLVFGGKIHTPNDTADRVYPGPLSETLRILDYWFYVLHGGPRIPEPRGLADYHYARLFRVRTGPERREEHWLAMKDSVEPNRRNLNGIYRVDVRLEGSVARCGGPRILHWGVDTQLRRETSSHLDASGGGALQAVPVSEIRVESSEGAVLFRRRPGGARPVVAAAEHAIGAVERFMGTNTFLAYFGSAFLLARAVEAVMAWAFGRWFAFQLWFFDWFAVTLPATILLQLAAVLWLVGKKIPTLIDNSYRHYNRADNLRSLRRVSS